jgi:hypothetical protein
MPSPEIYHLRYDRQTFSFLGDGKKLGNRFMAGKPKIAPRSRSVKISPGVDHALETGADLPKPRFVNF